MKNKFFKKDNAAKTIKVTPPKSNMNLPFSQPMNQNNDDEHSKSSEDKKTRIGRQPEMPFKGMDSKDSLSCPKCQYPLRIAPSASNLQPWRVIKEKDKEIFHFFIKKSKHYQRINCNNS